MPGLMACVLAAAAVALGADCMGKPCYPGNEYCGTPFANAPTYHLMDQHGCGENDPNGPVFDPVHGVIHHFYQIHLASAPGHGPDYGHFVSKDFVNWAALPVAIWNGLDSSVWPPRVTPYDNEAIFTGSALVLDGAGPGGKGPGIVNIYPGLCNKNDWPGCTTGTLLAQAVPANYAGDELLTNWSKPKYNPIVESTQRDPSTPWKTPSGEWRLRTYDSMVYAAASDADLLAGKWYTVGKSKDFRQCECPSFYPLPPPTPGFEAAYEAVRNGLPSHVHKTSCGGDWWQLGSYEAGAPKQLGNFTATPGWEDLFTQRRIDVGGFYASKDNLYPTKGSTVKRRINWGWAQVPPQSTQTLPREITFNAATRTLEQAPIAEVEGLRASTAYSSGSVAIAPGLALPVGSDVVKCGEVVVEFALPKAGSTAGTVYFGVSVGDPAAFGDVKRPAAAEDVSFADADYRPSPSRVTTTPALSCLFHWNPPTNKSAPYYEVPVSCGKLQDSLRVLTSASTVRLRLFLDATFIEAYFENGRVAMTLDAALSSGAPKLALTSTVPSMQVESAAVYSMRSIWTTPEAVRNAPRVYQ